MLQQGARRVLLLQELKCDGRNQINHAVYERKRKILAGTITSAVPVAISRELTVTVAKNTVYIYLRNESNALYVCLWCLIVRVSPFE
jgi:hypothetical protein